ncbi:MAG: hypothetical protein ACLSA6_14155 [Holdemania massiliensis]
MSCRRWWRKYDTAGSKIERSLFALDPQVRVWASGGVIYLPWLP